MSDSEVPFREKALEEGLSTTERIPSLLANQCPTVSSGQSPTEAAKRPILTRSTKQRAESESVTTESESEDEHKIKLTFNQKTYDLFLKGNQTVGDLQQQIRSVTGLAPDDQQLVFRVKQKESDDSDETNDSESDEEDEDEEEDSEDMIEELF